MDSIAYHFRAINPKFLDKRWEEGFELYYKAEEEDKDARFLKFTDYTPAVHKKILGMMQADNCQELFIHENDLIRYHKEVTFRFLETDLAKEAPALEKVKSIYGVTRKILQEYFVSIASTKILRSLSGMVELLEEQLTQNDLGPMDVYKITEKDHHTYTHCANAGLYCMSLGAKFKMKSEALRELGLGGMLFDIGKKKVPYGILFKKDQLTPQEFKMVRKHPAAGKKILNDTKYYSKNILRMAGEHHEKYDGEGYPFGLDGEKISPFARICSIMDVFAAMTSDASYHESHTPMQALMIMRDKMPGAFDQKIFVDFLRTLAAKS